MQGGRDKQKTEVGGCKTSYLSSEFGLINTAIVWTEKTISGELQHNVLAMFISKDNPGPFLMKFSFRADVDLLRQPLYWFQKEPAR